jgi:hypothetical protein
MKSSDCRFIRCPSAISLALCTLLCVATGARADEVALRKVSRALEKAQSQIDEYGTLQVSAPVLTYAKSNDFQFALRYGATNYFNDARTSIQGRAAGLEQVFQSLMLQGKGEMDPTVMAAYGEALKNHQQQAALHALQQNALLAAARLDFDAALASAATNTSIATSNQAVAQAHRAFAQAVYGTNGAPAFPTAEGFNGNLPSAPTNFFGLLTDTNYGRLIGFLPFLSLNSNQPSDLKIPNRSAIITAAGDNAVEAIFRTLGDSSIEGNFADKEKFFGLTMVSIDPGWRTRQGWAGEVVVSAELEFRPARTEVVRRIVENKTAWRADVVARIAHDYGFSVTDSQKLEAQGVSPQRALQLSAAATSNALDEVSSNFATVVPHHLQRKTENKPVSVAVVSPLTDNETLDLASSYRKQTEFAMALSFALRYAGAKGEAAAFEKFAKSRQFDIASRTPLTAVNAFSGQGGVFGFQIGPRVRALEDPASRKSGPGSILERQTFPALVLLGTSPGNIEPRLELSTNKTVIVYEPYIVLRQMRRWVPMKRAFFSGRDWYRPNDWFHPQLSEGERLSTVNLLEAARASVTNLGWKATSFGWTNDPSATLFQRLDYYEEQLIGSLDRITLPAERIVPDAQMPTPLRVAQITSVKPGSVMLKLGSDGKPEPVTNLFILEGQDLDALRPASVKTHATNSSATLKMASKTALAIEAVVSNAAHPMVFSFDLDTNKAPTGVILSPPVQVSTTETVSRIPRVDVMLPTSVTLERDDKNQVIALTNRFVLLGVGLKQIDTTNVSIATGRALPLKVEAIGDGLVVELVISNALEAVTLKLPIRGASDEAILSKPINVSIRANAATEKAAPQTLRVEQKSESGNGASSIAVTVASDAKADALQAATKVVVSELEKKKPGVLLKDQRIEEIGGTPASPAK